MCHQLDRLESLRGFTVHLKQRWQVRETVRYAGTIQRSQREIEKSFLHQQCPADRLVLPVDIARGSDPAESKPLLDGLQRWKNLWNRMAVVMGVYMAEWDS